MRVSFTSVLVASSAIGASAFAPEPLSFAQRSTKLQAKQEDSLDGVGKAFAVAALSFAMFMNPSPALADGKDIFGFSFLWIISFTDKSIIRSNKNFQASSN